MATLQREDQDFTILTSSKAARKAGRKPRNLTQIASNRLLTAHGHARRIRLPTEAGEGQVTPERRRHRLLLVSSRIYKHRLINHVHRVIAKWTVSCLYRILNCMSLLYIDTNYSIQIILYKDQF